MDAKQNLRQNDIVNHFKGKLGDLKDFKKQLEEAYNDKSTSHLQKNDKFFSIINNYRSTLEEVQRIIDEELVNINAPNIPVDLIMRIDSDQSIKEYMQERKQQVKRQIEFQQEKQENIAILTSQFEQNLVNNKILP